MPAAATQLQLKANYRPTSKLQVFYTGGAARVTRDGKLLACTCTDEVKVRADATPGCRQGPLRPVSKQRQLAFMPTGGTGAPRGFIGASNT